MAEFEITSATGQPYFAFLFRINFYTYLFLAIFVAFLENLMSQHLFAESALFCSEYASAKSISQDPTWEITVPAWRLHITGIC